ncbi:MAG: thermonuclease family protein [Coriobacteriia bacterium]|nr:thermonuclease family protein [Coriobacteriia bacterium]
MWQRQMFSRNARIALSAVGAIIALGLLSSALPRAGTVPVEDRPSRIGEEQPAQPETKPTERPTPEPEPEPKTSFSKVTVTRVVDGDTVEVTYEDGKVEKVRFIGVDCPESTNEVEPYGQEASAYTKRELDGKTVYLETDAELRDKYGRLLAYVWLEEPSSTEPGEREIRQHLFNAQLLLAGYAQLMTIPPNVKYVETYKVFQEEARNEQAGLWAPEPEPEPEPEPKPKPPSDSSETVYVTNTGEKYHRDGCRYLSKSKIPISLADAKAQGYEPCKVCKPPQ